MLRLSSVEGEEDQNATWFLLNIFNKDDNEQYKTTKHNVKNQNSPIWCKQRPEQSHKALKEYGCLNMVPNQRQR